MGLTRAAARPGEPDSGLGCLRPGRDHLHAAGGTLTPRRCLRSRPQRPALDDRPSAPPTNPPDRATRHTRAARADPGHGDGQVSPRTVCQRRRPGSGAATGTDRPVPGHHPARCHGGGVRTTHEREPEPGLHDAAAGRHSGPERADRSRARRTPARRRRHDLRASSCQGPAHRLRLAVRPSPARFRSPAPGR